MKFRFDPDLEYQTKAIQAAVRLFEGTQPLDRGFALISENGVVGNRLTLSDAALLANLRAVQQDPDLHNGRPIPPSASLDSRDFSVEMETGTGKTYVYLRTALELHQAYGFRKFIVVVPSVAIREGVLKTLQITREHFTRLYDHLPYRFYQYDSGNLARVRQFAASNDVEIMVMTLDSFNKDTNIFNRRMDRMMGLKPLELVQASRPILILDEPVEFIFSHSALREGWDNPNIFQICTLNRTISTIRKRQEIGRGMRLAVNQAGERVFDDQINRLTVVANESYREYVDRLQKEYIDEVGSGQEPPQPKDARQRRTVRLKKGYELNPEFKELWRRIARRTRYRVRLDTDALIRACAEAVKPITIEPIKVRTERGRVDRIRERGMFETTLLGQGAVAVDIAHRVPNVAALLAEETNLTRRTLRRILGRAGNLDQVYHNPAEYIQRAGEAINRAKRRFLVDGVQYLEIEDGYEMSLFENLEGYADSLLPIEKSIYDHVIYDSRNERDFAQTLEAMDEVRLFVKLPAWFTVPTPIGDYNPDWAIVFHIQDSFGETREKLYLVRETKATDDPEERRGLENLKIRCAGRHFQTIDVDYDVATDAQQFREKILANRP
jgi:restriction endonuclease